MNDTIKQLIDKYEEKGDFTYAKVDEQVLNACEKKLNVKLPGQFLDYLSLYGSGGIGGIGTLGIGADGSLMFAEETIEFRKYELPQNLIVIENCDEWVYCIDCDTEKIVFWDMSGYIKEKYNCFDDYLIDQMNDVIENL